MVTAFKIIVLVALVTSLMGGVAGRTDEKKIFARFFGCAGVLFLAGLAVEKLM